MHRAVLEAVEDRICCYFIGRQVVVGFVLEASHNVILSSNCLMRHDCHNTHEIIVADLTVIIQYNTIQARLTTRHM